MTLSTKCCPKCFTDSNTWLNYCAFCGAKLH